MAKGFTERNPIVLGLVALVLVVGVGVAGLSVQRADLTGGYELTAEFTDANGLRPGDQVTVAGIRVGQVLGIDIVGDHVEARLQIEGTELPTSTRAAISPQTLVGKRAVELETGRDFAQLLGQGDRIPLSRTAVTTDVPEFGDVSEELLSNLDAEALNTFLGSLTDLTEDQREEVALLIEGGNRLTTLVNEEEQEIRAVLRNLRAVSATLNEQDDELISIIDNFQPALAEVNARQAEIERLFTETTRTSNEAADTVATIRSDLDATLTELHADIELAEDHQVALSEALAYGPDALTGFGSITFAGDQPVPFGHVFTTQLGPLGLNTLFDCGGQFDQTIDQVLGPDPRGCQTDTFPDDVDEEGASESSTPLPGSGPPPIGPGGALGVPQPEQLVPQGLEGVLDGVLGEDAAPPAAGESGAPVELPTAPALPDADAEVGQ